MPITHDECPQLLSLAVHEFRTPVTVVAGYLRMLLKLHGTALGDQPRKLVEEAEKSCARLAALIAELSELSHAEGGGLVLDRQPVDFGALVAEAAGSVQEGRDRDVRLRVALPREPVRLAADKRRLVQALETVMAATLRERAEPGTLVAACGIQPAPDGEVAWLTLAPDGDGGGRFAAADWAPLEQWRGGMGFRLLLADAIVTAHGGTLYSGSGSRARGTCALALPLQETPQ